METGEDEEAWRFLVLFIAAIAAYYFIVSGLIRLHYNEMDSQEKYIKGHSCKLIEVIPSRPVGMMIHGETDIYVCPDGKIVRVN
jgi:hypothetical protein